VLYAPTVIDDKLILLAFIASGAQLFPPTVFLGEFPEWMNIEVSLTPALGMGVSLAAPDGVDVSLETDSGVEVTLERATALDVSLASPTQITVSIAPTEE
jgi:hypothetical protein